MALTGREEVRTERMFIRYGRHDHSRVVGLEDGEEPEEVGEPTEDGDVLTREGGLGGGLKKKKKKTR